MAAPIADVDVCRLALDRCGQEISIASINPPTPGNAYEAMLARHYDLERLNVLRSHPWHFATQQVLISRIGTPISDFADAYQLPSDYVRFLSVGGTVEEWQRHKYRIVANQQLWINNSLPTGIDPTLSNIVQTTTDATVVSNNVSTETITTTIVGDVITTDYDGGVGTASASTINLRYIFNETNLTNWVYDAVKLFYLRLAHAIPFKITKSAELVESIRKEIEEFTPSVYAVSGQENVPIRIERSRAIERRRYALSSAIVASPYTIVD